MLGHQVRDVMRVKRPGQRAAHVEQLAELCREPAGLGEQRRAGKGGRGLVGEDHQQPEVVVVELVEAQLREGDHADERIVMPHGHDQHRFVDVVGTGDGGGARIAPDIADPERQAVAGDPAGQPQTHLRPEDVEIDLVVGTDAALERDWHEVIGLLEQVDARVVVIDDALRLLDHGPAHLGGAEARAHPLGRALQHQQLAGATGFRRPRPAHQRSGEEDGPPDGEVEDDDQVLDRGWSARDGPAGDAERQGNQATAEGQPVEA